ncbi:MAG TPA: hypothetical protein VLG50_05360 [Candidatus Saccharimonadales bacterium]|nr:hypothetical protein [Candidatus Saccharimonadales bacterium]
MNTDLLSVIAQYQSIDDVIQLCHIDNHMYTNVCSKKSFWQPIFKKYNYPMPRYDVSNTNDWIKEFLKIQQVIRDIDDTMVTFNNHNMINLAPNEDIAFSDVNKIANQLKLTKLESSSTINDMSLNFIGINKLTNNNQYYLFFITPTGGYISYNITHTQLLKFLFKIFLRHKFTIEKF